MNNLGRIALSTVAIWVSQIAVSEDSFAEVTQSENPYLHEDYNIADNGNYYSNDNYPLEDNDHQYHYVMPKNDADHYNRHRNYANDNRYEYGSARRSNPGDIAQIWEYDLFDY